MKDLDFDELDKAVNSLMGGVKEKDTSDAAQTLDISTTLAPDEKPAYSNLSQVAGHIGSEAIDRQEKTVSIEAETPTPVPVSASSKPKHEIQRTPQKAGRFMDVVHPSSDMKRGALAKVSREGTTLAPVATTSVESVSAQQEEEQSAPQTEDLPQPSDTSGNLPLSVAPSVDLDPEDSADNLKSAAQEPLSSPFLPDAKVEKRPLGSEPPTGTFPVLPESGVEFDAGPEPVPQPNVETVTKQDESSVMDSITNPSKDDDIAVHVPEEFQDELLAVEKNTDAAATETEPAHHTPEGPLATASIPKQYHEKPSSGETKSGAIFDTDHYHKPVAHPAKKSSGWLWVTAIVVIIALGAGAGAFVYFVGL